MPIRPRRHRTAPGRTRRPRRAAACSRRRSSRFPEVAVHLRARSGTTKKNGRWTRLIGASPLTARKTRRSLRLSSCKGAPSSERWTGRVPACPLELPALSGFSVAEIVPEDFAVVEAELRPRYFRLAEPARVLGVVRGLQGAAPDLAPVHGRDGVLAVVALRIGVGEELLDQIDVEAGLLLRLADAGLPYLFPVIDESAGDGPAVRDVLPQDEHDAAIAAVDDGVRGRERIAMLGHQGGRMRPELAGRGGCRPRANRCSRAWTKRPRPNDLLAGSSRPRARETASAIRAGSIRFSMRRTWAISKRRFAYRTLRCAVKYASPASDAAWYMASFFCSSLR